MRKTGAFILCFALSGCAAIDPNKLPSGTTAYNAAFKKSQSEELDLIVEFQNEDRLLRFLTAGRYSCGDPTATNIRTVLAIEDPEAAVAKKYSAFAEQKSLEVLEEYNKFLAQVLKNGEADQKTILAFGEAAKSVAALFPAGAAAAIITGPASVLAADLRGNSALHQMRAGARFYRPQLDAAVNIIKATYPSLTEQRRVAFQLWDRCARERLIVMRDLPAGRVRGYEDLADRVGLPSTVELAEAYGAYLAKRRTFLAESPVIEALDSMLKENSALIEEANSINTAALAATVDKAAKLAAAAKSTR